MEVTPKQQHLRETVSFQKQSRKGRPVSNTKEKQQAKQYSKLEPQQLVRPRRGKHKKGALNARLQMNGNSSKKPIQPEALPGSHCTFLIGLYSSLPSSTWKHCPSSWLQFFCSNPGLHFLFHHDLDDAWPQKHLFGCQLSYPISSWQYHLQSFPSLPVLVQGFG